MSIFDSEPHKKIAATLVTEVPSAAPSRFDVIGHPLTAVDGYRIHAHFEARCGVPERVDATPAKPQGKDDETSVLASVLPRILIRPRI